MAKELAERKQQLETLPKPVVESEESRSRQEEARLNAIEALKNAGSVDERVKAGAAVLATSLSELSGSVGEQSERAHAQQDRIREQMQALTAAIEKLRETVAGFSDSRECREFCG